MRHHHPVLNLHRSRLGGEHLHTEPLADRGSLTCWPGVETLRARGENNMHHATTRSSRRRSHSAQSRRHACSPPRRRARQQFPMQLSLAADHDWCTNINGAQGRRRSAVGRAHQLEISRRTSSPLPPAVVECVSLARSSGQLGERFLGEPERASRCFDSPAACRRHPTRQHVVTTRDLSPPLHRFRHGQRGVESWRQGATSP